MDSISAKKILHISFDFNYSCGVSKYVFNVLKYLSEQPKYKLYLLTNGGDSLNRLENLNVEIKTSELHTSWGNFLYLIKDLILVYRFCRENKIQIIHTHHRYAEFIALLVAKLLGIKTISTVHSLVKGKKLLSFGSDKLLCVSNAVKRMLIEEYGVPLRKVDMMYNCVAPMQKESNLSKDQIRENIGIRKGIKIILYLGRLTEIKNVHSLISAFEIVHNKYPQTCLLIIGKDYDGSVPARSRHNPSIKVLVPVENPFQYYLIADMVIVPSLREPLSYVMLETGLMKKPFIGSRTGGIEEFIENNRNGLLFKPGEVNQLADKITYVLKNPEVTKSLGYNLYKKVVKECSCENYFRKLDRIYNELSC